jgi:hypothetical protein
MKKLLVTLAAVLVSVSTFGQGTINFNNLVSSANINAPVFKPDGTTGAGAAPTANAQLFLVGGSAGAQTFTAIPSSLTTFRASPAGAAQGYINPIGNVVVDGLAGGASATVVMRAWEGTSGYDASLVKGQSAPITLTLGGAGSPPSVPANLVGLASFSMVAIPEPSTMALGLLGAAALLYRRRK